MPAAQPQGAAGLPSVPGMLMVTVTWVIVLVQPAPAADVLTAE
jgi:hypothetical protein